MAASVMKKWKLELLVLTSLLSTAAMGELLQDPTRPPQGVAEGASLIFWFWPICCTRRASYACRRSVFHRCRSWHRLRLSQPSWQLGFWPPRPQVISPLSSLNSPPPKRSRAKCWIRPKRWPRTTTFLRQSRCGEQGSVSRYCSCPLFLAALTSRWKRVSPKRRSRLSRRSCSFGSDRSAPFHAPGQFALASCPWP